MTTSGGRPPHVPGKPPNIWALHGYAVAATNVWHFQLAPDQL
jgi:hypothetical protein